MDRRPVSLHPAGRQPPSRPRPRGVPLSGGLDKRFYSSRYSFPNCRVPKIAGADAHTDRPRLFAWRPKFIPSAPAVPPAREELNNCPWIPLRRQGIRRAKHTSKRRFTGAKARADVRSQHRFALERRGCIALVEGTNAWRGRCRQHVAGQKERTEARNRVQMLRRVGHRRAAAFGARQLWGGFEARSFSLAAGTPTSAMLTLC